MARNDTHFRTMEGLEERVEVLAGTPDPELTVDYLGLRLAVDLLGGQKTGLFLDQRDNQALFLPSAASGRVLDAFCYQGTWGLIALQNGADEVVGVDTSAGALDFAERHARANALSERTEWIRQDVIEALKVFKDAGRTFDTVILDPPAFVKSKKHLKAGLRGYLDLNLRGLNVLAPGGTLITCSCSHHVQPEAFRDTVSHAASLARRHVRVLGSGTQSRDHPPLITAPETEYLKCLVLHAE
ncbi:MAG: class I SAM-dependent methyltransferase [bacterium]